VGAPPDLVAVRATTSDAVALAQQVQELVALVHTMRHEVADLRAQVVPPHAEEGAAVRQRRRTRVGRPQVSSWDLVTAGMLKPLPTRGHHPKFSRIEVEKLAANGLAKRKAGRPVKVVHDEFASVDAALAAVRAERRAGR